MRLAHKAEEPNLPLCSEAGASDMEREPQPRSLACKRVVAAAIVLDMVCAPSNFDARADKPVNA